MNKGVIITSRVYCSTMKNIPFTTVIGATLLSIGMLFTPAAWSACQPQAMNYDYPAQRLDEALQQFAHTSGCFVEVDTQQLGDKQAQALSGHYTPSAALIRLVRGSGLEVHVDGEQYAVNHNDREAITQQIEALRGRIDSARQNGRIDEQKASDMSTQLDAVAQQVPQLIEQQGFLSAAENASYQRLFAWMSGVLAP
ncbi:STN domain-containing protein [Kushneria aurantia]|uniref:STN domain-containing protein n=1 Tax=Kushneria aurantia TaxID=504092 RepID=A0ABV6G0E0_9GAMM|nr:STN domain-containing protein [Kushneria aurantia]